MSGFIPRDLERHPVRAEHGVPMARSAEGLSAEKHRPRLLRRVALRWHADTHPYALYAEVRKLAGKELMATTAIVDSQSVKSAEKGGLGSMLPATMRARKSKARSVTSLSTRLA